MAHSRGKLKSLASRQTGPPRQQRLVQTEVDRIDRRVQVQADDVLDRLGRLGIWSRA